MTEEILYETMRYMRVRGRLLFFQGKVENFNDLEKMIDRLPIPEEDRIAARTMARERFEPLIKKFARTSLEEAMRNFYLLPTYIMPVDPKND